MSANEIVHGDCELYMGSLPDGAADVIITDPPYSEHTHKAQRLTGGTTATGNKCVRSVDLGFPHLTREDCFRLALPFARIAKRWIVIFSDHELSHDWRDALTNAGLDVVRHGVWIKEACTPQLTGDRPAAGHEVITIAHRRCKKRWNGGGRRAVWTHPIVNPSYAREERVHTTQKPLALMLDLVRDFSEPGELVFDPFAGSGTTGVAAARLGRRFLGCEKQDAYVGVARERLIAESSGLDYAAYKAKQTSMFGGAQ